MLLNGVINVYISQDTAVDLYLQMCCMEYLKNFYNDADFKINKYAHLLPKVLEICNSMIQKYAAVQGNIEVINEILELYRLIVEKYAGYQGETDIS
jgi:ubiquinone biosynthesis protein UbiJ